LGSSSNRSFLIVASSGRALAASARRGGYACAVLDLFADADLDALSPAHERVARGAAGGFDAEELLAAAARLAPRGGRSGADPPFGLVYGSGFEDRPELLVRLMAGRELFGNGPEILARAKDPFIFAQMLDELGLPHPEVRHDKPGDAAAWLVKRIGGAGGIHIRHARDEPDGTKGRYYQRFVEGTPVSALVIGNGRKAATLGLSEQWAAPGSPAQPFRFGGAAVPAAIPAALARRLEEAADALARRLKLTGLNSVDFIADTARGEFHAIEVNPRPGATLDIFERISGRSLFDLHVKACRGDLPQGRFEPAAEAASAILYTQRDLEIAPGFSWPEWTADIPRPGTWLTTGEPVCSVFAGNRDGVLARAEALRAAIEQCMQSSFARDPAACLPRETGGNRRGPQQGNKHRD
jgi:predicted ATP-grasp superfamily ATP-dependent carboligase